jgi:hypothetical protein
MGGGVMLLKKVFDVTPAGVALLVGAVLGLLSRTGGKGRAKSPAARFPE